jgi:HEAT repeat protein
MPHLDKYRHDPRSVNEMINAILTEADEETVWDAITAVRVRGSVEVLDRARELCRSSCLRERSFGAIILGQLGSPNRTFPNECVETILRLIDVEPEPTVLHDAFIALGHLADPRVIPAAEQFQSHPDPEVRDGVVFSLLGHVEAPAIAILVRLSRDEDPHVRDWATFGLGTQLELDTPKIREALAARLDDPDENTRGEAFVGLAYRRDPRAIPYVELAWNSEEIGDKAREAAERLGIAVNTSPALVELDPRHSIETIDRPQADELQI